MGLRQVLPLQLTRPWFWQKHNDTPASPSCLLCCCFRQRKKVLPEREEWERV